MVTVDLVRSLALHFFYCRQDIRWLGFMVLNLQNTCNILQIPSKHRYLTNTIVSILLSKPL